MFEQCFLGDNRTHRTWTVVVAFGGQVLAICILVATPLFFIEAPSVTQLTTTWLTAPPPPPPPPPPPALAQARAPKEHTSRKFDASQLIAPRAIPKQVAAIVDLQVPTALSDGGVIGGVPGGVPGGVVGGIIGSLAMAAAPPPPPPPPQKADAPKPVERIRIGGNVQAALLIRRVDPQYPVLARQAHVDGSVILRAFISRDGKVQDLVLVSGNPLLVHAAMDAVKQWVYKPTYLDGNPVEVLTEVSVNFHLTATGHEGGG